MSNFMPRKNLRKNKIWTKTATAANNNDLSFRLALCVILKYFPQKTDFDISCKLSPMETVCMKCQSLFSGGKKENIIFLSSAEFAKRVVMVNLILG